MLSYVDRYRYAFSWTRLLNCARVLASLGVSRVLRRPIVWGHPFVMMVEPSSLCNLQCPLCPSGNGLMSRDRGNMDLAAFEGLIDEGARHLILLMLWNQGEPFINKAFLEMIRYAHQRRIPTLTSTNGHFVRTIEQARAVVESGLDEIIISLDGVDQETYERYRVGGRIEHVLACARLLAQAKQELDSRTPFVSLQFLVFRHNESDLERAQQLAGELKADRFLVKTAQVYEPAEAEAFLPETEKYRRYEREGGDELIVKGQPVRGCKVLWYSATVNWDGTVAPCCFDKDVDFEMGQAFDGLPFGEVWKSRAYTDFRRRVLVDRGDIDMCRNCSEGYRGMFSLVKELRG